MEGSFSGEGQLSETGLMEISSLPVAQRSVMTAEEILSGIKLNRGTRESLNFCSTLDSRTGGNLCFKNGISCLNRFYTSCYNVTLRRNTRKK